MGPYIYFLWERDKKDFFSHTFFISDGTTDHGEFLSAPPSFAIRLFISRVVFSRR